MQYLNYFILSGIIILFSGCAVKPTIQNQYQLTGYSEKRIVSSPVKSSIFIRAPEAMAGYDTIDMLYTIKRYELRAFAHNTWVRPPAEMILPLIVKSLSKSGYFRVVAVSPSIESTAYQLDTQLLELDQNFLTKPSQIQLALKVTLVKTKGNEPLSSRIFTYKIQCPTDTPYGGVLAANQGLRLFTEELTHFIVRQVRLS